MFKGQTEFWLMYDYMYKHLRIIQTFLCRIWEIISDLHHNLLKTMTTFHIKFLYVLKGI